MWQVNRTTREYMPRAVRRAQMVAAGALIACEHGLLAVSAGEVAARIGVHENLVFRYVGRRDVLLAEIIATAREQRIASIVSEADQLGL